MPGLIERIDGKHLGYRQITYLNEWGAHTYDGSFKDLEGVGAPISQMPRHLISDAHEWINEIPAVPIYYLAKPQPRERAWQN